MKIYNKKLNEADNPQSLMSKLHRDMIDSDYMKDKKGEIDTSNPDHLEKMGKPDKTETLKTPEQYANGNSPCTVYISNDKKQSAVIKHETFDSEAFIKNIVKNVVNNFNSSVMFNDPKNYQAFVFGYNNVKICELDIVDGVCNPIYFANLYTVSIFSVNAKNKQQSLIKKSSVLPPKKAEELMETNKKALEKIQLDDSILKSIETNSEKVVEDSLTPEKETYIYKVTIDESNPKFPQINKVSYQITEVNLDSNSCKLLDVNSGKELDVKIEDILKDYYDKTVSDYDVKLFNERVLITFKFTQETGDKDVPKELCNQSYYVSNENYESYQKEVRKQSQSESLFESNFDMKFKDVLINLYDKMGNLTSQTVLNFSNITEIKKQINIALMNDYIYAIDVIDSTGTSHYQARKFFDDGTLRFEWNVMEDDFYETSKDSKYERVMNEEITGNTYLVDIHLPYYDTESYDTFTYNPTRKIQITAETENQAKQYAEQYIRVQQFSNKDWDNAFIENIEQLES